MSEYACRLAKFILNDLSGISKKHGFMTYDLPEAFTVIWIIGEIEGLWTRHQVRKWADTIFKEMESQKMLKENNK